MEDFFSSSFAYVLILTERNRSGDLWILDDNIGGNAGAAWDYYLFTKDRNWLAQAYPHLRAAADWIRYHRAESDLETGDVPPGAKPIRREIRWSCKPETGPALQPGEKPYWSGLLPWSCGERMPVSS